LENQTSHEKTVKRWAAWGGFLARIDWRDQNSAAGERNACREIWQKACSTMNGSEKMFRKQFLVLFHSTRENNVPRHYQAIFLTVE